MSLARKCLSFALKLTGILALGFLASYAQDAPKQDTHGINVANMDRSAKPGDNWYEYCNGEWIKRTEIPPDRSRLGVFTTLADVSDKRTSALIEEAAEERRHRGLQRAQNCRSLQLLYGRGRHRSQRSCPA